MLVIGRISEGALIKHLPHDRQVVVFSVAENDWYKSKANEKGVQVTTFYNCSYWMHPAIAPLLTKGTTVEIAGRISVNTWMDKQGNPKAAINCHVKSIKIHHKGRPQATEPVQAEPAVEGSEEDLPF